MEKEEKLNEVRAKTKQHVFPFEANNIPGKGDTYKYMGLTKRELFAAMAMQGLLSASDELAGKTMNEHFDNIAKLAVGHADALIMKLN